MMGPSAKTIWLYGTAPARARAGELLRALGPLGQCLCLGPGLDPAPDLELEPGADLGLALEACPPELRPQACLWLAEPGQEPPPGLEELPCPVLGWGAPGPEGLLPAEPGLAALAVREALAAGLVLPHLERVQVGVPLRELLGQYRYLLEGLPANLEVGIDYLALDSLGPADLAQARGLLEGRRVTVHMPFGDLVPGSPDPKVAALALERLGQAGRWGLKLGAMQAVMHLGYDQRLHQPAEDYAARLAQTMAPLARELAQGGCRLALENTFEPGPGPLLLCRQALEDAGAPGVGFCLDVGHTMAFSSTGLAQWWEALAPHLAEMHLHDNDGQGDRHWPVGRGQADWEYLRQGLLALERLPVLTIEPHREPDLWAALRGLPRHLGGVLD